MASSMIDRNLVETPVKMADASKTLGTLGISKDGWVNINFFAG